MNRNHYLIILAVIIILVAGYFDHMSLKNNMLQEKERQEREISEKLKELEEFRNNEKIFLALTFPEKLMVCADVFEGFEVKKEDIVVKLKPEVLERIQESKDWTLEKWLDRFLGISGALIWENKIIGLMRNHYSFSRSKLLMTLTNNDEVEYFRPLIVGRYIRDSDYTDRILNTEFAWLVEFESEEAKNDFWKDKEDFKGYKSSNKYPELEEFHQYCYMEIPDSDRIHAQKYLDLWKDQSLEKLKIKKVGMLFAWSVKLDDPWKYYTNSEVKNPDDLGTGYHGLLRNYKYLKEKNK